MDDWKLDSEELDDGELDREPLMLVDENGEEVPFELLDLVEYNGAQYAVVTPWTDGDEDEDEDVETLILRTEEDGEDLTFLPEDDESISEAVFQLFLDRMDAAGEDDGEED